MTTGFKTMAREQTMHNSLEVSRFLCSTSLASRKVDNMRMNW